MDVWVLLEWVGRIVFAGFFVMSGANHLLRLQGTAAYAQSKGVPVPALATIVTGLMLLAGGFAILLRWHSTLGAALLVAFLVPVAFVMHNFWVEADPMAKANQMAQWWKNIALAAACVLYAVAHHRGAL
ncbi:MAG TPA: DoxX family protein [Gemmatimonadales bacterium]|nr:DoxX family protein [Gemmatimonadales bacterium]